MKIIPLLPPEGILELRRFCLDRAIQSYSIGEADGGLTDDNVVSTAEAYENYMLRDYKGE
jgi:hypothetical protein